MSVQTPERNNAAAVLPSWFRQPLPDMGKVNDMKGMLRGAKLHTVCESAHCPNLGQCWGQGVATFMILGNVCTRACRFCAVAAGRGDMLDAEEPMNVAQSVVHLKLNYVVVTSVARDDLADEGAGHFVATIEAIRRLSPRTKIEVLIPDFSGREELLNLLSQSAPEVISHNIECVKRVSPLVRPQAEHKRSLDVLRHFRRSAKRSFVKSSFMLGLGETREEVRELMGELLDAGCQILTIGQYLAPTTSRRHVRVARFAAPDEFEQYRQEGMRMGFKYVESGPLVRSSYIAEKGYQQALMS